MHVYVYVYMSSWAAHALHIAGLLFLIQRARIERLKRNIGEVLKMAARIPPHGTPSYMHGYQAAGRYMAGHPSMVRYHYVITS